MRPHACLPPKHPGSVMPAPRAITRAAALVWAMVVGAMPALAQAPDTEIFLIPITSSDSGPALGLPRNITNRPGYDNQPAFTPDGQSILYTSAGEDGQADIFRYELASGIVTRLTSTAPESEYSATMIPGQRAISVVRVERDSTQRLWRFPLRGGAPSVILPDVQPVGYYAWADSTTLFLFVLGDPPTLQRANVREASVYTVDDSIGRSIQAMPDGGVSIVLKRSPDEWWIARVDPATDSIAPLVRTRPGQEDYAWMPDGSLLQADGATVYRWDGGEWTPIATFSEPGLARLTRLAVSPDGRWLAAVGSAAEER
jgi:WD40 repeat protein